MIRHHIHLYTFPFAQNTGRGMGKYVYRQNLREEGEIFLREEISKYFPNNKIEYII